MSDMTKKSMGRYLKKMSLFDILNYGMLILFSVSIVLPFWGLFVKSISRPEDISVSFMLFPKKVTFDSYRMALMSRDIYIGYFNTIFRVLFTTILTLLVSVLTAYPLSRRNLPFRNGITLFILFTMFFTGGLIPSYMLIRWLSLIDNRWSLILPGLVYAFNIVIMRNYFMFSIERSLEESAEIDGANQFTILFRIIVPLSMPVIATIGLWTIVGNWNEWFYAMIYINSKQKEVLQLVLRKILLSYDATRVASYKNIAGVDENQFSPESLKFAFTYITILPVLCIYPFIQKYFAKGIMIGSLKG